MKGIIGIDAGHGGSSFGTYGVNTVNDGLFEKDYTLELALMLEEKLRKNGFDVIMSRSTDENPGNVSQRAEKMVGGGANFALSIHFNGFKNEAANGTEVFVPYGEDIGFVEAGFQRELGKYFALRKPFARSSSYYNRDETFDKKLNIETGKFEAVCDKKDYFGFIRTCWEKGVSADLIEICFLTNKSDFEIYQRNKEKIASALAKSVVLAFGEKYIDEESKIKITKPKIAKPKMLEKYGYAVK